MAIAMTKLTTDMATQIRAANIVHKNVSMPFSANNNETNSIKDVTNDNKIQKRTETTVLTTITIMTTTSMTKSAHKTAMSTAVAMKAKISLHRCQKGIQ